MQPETVAAILDRIAELWSVEPGAEITLEANPGSVEAARFRGYRAAGVNRVSLGVQSLRDDILKSLGRIHSVAEAKAAIEIARTTFDRFSFDLIYARPGQTVTAWKEELRDALASPGSTCRSTSSPSSRRRRSPRCTPPASSSSPTRTPRSRSTRRRRS